MASLADRLVKSPGAKSIETRADNPRSPADRVALRVMLPGEHHEFEKTAKFDFQVRASKDPLRIKIPLFREAQKLAQQLTGTKFGRWTVIGYSTRQHKNSKKRGAIWVVRCNCGRYEERKLKALANAQASDDCCWECQQLKKLRWRDKNAGQAIT
jgi:hypothetical protein